MSKIVRTGDDKSGRFTMIESGKEIGKMQYKWLSPSKFEIYSTVIEKGFEGDGNATELLNVAVKYARDNQKTISATCSFAKNKFESTSVYEDVYEKN